MCGIAGILDATLPGEVLARRAEAMATALAHRGPDDADVWTDEPAGLALAHRRLAIQDLSPAGRQPMLDASGRWALSYNGEIFSAPEIRREMLGDTVRLRGHSDTEIMLEAIARRGLDAVLPRLVGQFAIALWDRRDRRLTLIRDRVGIKPLYWARIGRRIAFASELRGILPALDRRPGLSREGLGAYLRTGVVPAPLTIHESVWKLEPGTLMTVEEDGSIAIERYWDLAERIAAIEPRDRIADPAEARDLVEATLGEAVRCRLLADVPLGAFLSGGIDSSLVTALMVEASPSPVASYSIGSPDAAYDEGRAAAEVASRLGTHHHALTVGEAEALAAVPEIGRVGDEPFGDSSLLPTLLLSRLTRGHVTVALSGDGGDEVFAGYNRHRWHQKAAGLKGPLGALAAAAAAGAERLPPAVLDWIGRRLLGEAGAARRIHKLSGILAAGGNTGAAHRAALRQWPGLGPETAAGDPPGYAALGRLSRLGHLAPHERMQALDLLTYLPDDVLTKVDRASMATALEVRVPFLDHRVIEAGFRLAPELKLAGRETKAILRRMLEARLPRALIDRPKSGFAVPIESWLRGPLRGWAEALIADTPWRQGFEIDPAPIRAAWDAHKAGRSDEADRLWTILMLADWWHRAD